jgi:hypothetical protein
MRHLGRGEAIIERLPHLTQMGPEFAPWSKPSADSPLIDQKVNFNPN